MYDGLPVRHCPDGLELHLTANYRNYFGTDPRDRAKPKFTVVENSTGRQLELTFRKTGCFCTEPPSLRPRLGKNCRSLPAEAVATLIDTESALREKGHSEYSARLSFLKSAFSTVLILSHGCSNAPVGSMSLTSPVPVLSPFQNHLKGSCHALVSIAVSAPLCRHSFCLQCRWLSYDGWLRRKFIGHGLLRTGQLHRRCD